MPLRAPHSSGVTLVALASAVLPALLGACGTADSAHGFIGTEDAGVKECGRVFLDGRGGVPTPPNGASHCAPGLCNYQTQTGCEFGQSCRPQYPAGAISVAPGCEESGTAERGDPCEVSTDCGRGLLCVTGQCRKQCCGGDWSACDPGESCIRQLFIAFGADEQHAVDLCFPVGTCDPLDRVSCADEPGRECKIVDATGAVACAPTSTSAVGDACAPPTVCAQGATCVGGVCRRLCRAEVCGEPGCPPGEGACIHFDRNPPGVGECVPGR